MAAGELTSHDFLFGTGVEDTVEWIVVEAIREGTKEAFESAVLQLKGIRRFMMQLGLGIVAMRLDNETRKIAEMAENDELRESVIAAMRAERPVAA